MGQPVIRPFAAAWTFRDRVRGTSGPSYPSGKAAGRRRIQTCPSSRPVRLLLLLLHLHVSGTRLRQPVLAKRFNVLSLSCPRDSPYELLLLHGSATRQRCQRPRGSPVRTRLVLRESLACDTARAPVVDHVTPFHRCTLASFLERTFYHFFCFEHLPEYASYAG